MAVYQEAALSTNVYSIVEKDKFGEQPIIYLIIGNEKSILIDTGIDTDDLREFIKEKFGENAIDNLIVINTHTHYDHVGGNYRFSDRPIYASSLDKGFVADTSLNMADAVGFELKNFEVTNWVEDGEKISLSSSDPEDYLQIFHTPGHSPDSLSIWYPKASRLFVGDLVYRKYPVICFTPQSDLKAFSASVTKILNFVDKMEMVGQSISLSCGHVDTNLESHWLRKFSDLLQDVISGRAAGTKRQDPRFTYYSTLDGFLSLKHADLVEFE